MEEKHTECVEMKTYWSRAALLLGNLFDHYDGALYGLLAPFLAPLFFPQKDPVIALILTYAVMPLGMLARPIGSLVFGHIGDTRGRKNALVLALAGMAITTACMGVLPTYAQVGLLAPVLLSFGRILQNFFGAGENIGGVITLLEEAKGEKERRAITGLYNASTVGGILLASCAIALGVPWRLLYLGGACTLFFANIVRKRMSPSRLIRPSGNRLEKAWSYRGPFFILMLLFGFSYSTFSVAIVMVSGLVPLITSISKAQMMQWNTYLLALDLVVLPIFAYFSGRVMRIALAFALFGPFLFLFLESGSFLAIFIVRAILVLIGAAFSASMQHLSMKLLPQEYRYSLGSLAYSIGVLLFGGPTTVVSLWLYHKTHIVAAASLYWSALALASLVALAKARSYGRAGSKDQFSQGVKIKF